MEEWGRVRRDVASVIASVTPKDGKGPGQGLEAWSSGQDPKEGDAKGDGDDWAERRTVTCAI
jgi:hypothetical protein